MQKTDLSRPVSMRLVLRKGLDLPARRYLQACRDKGLQTSEVLRHILGRCGDGKAFIDPVTGVMFVPQAAPEGRQTTPPLQDAEAALRETLAFARSETELKKVASDFLYE